MINLMLCGNDKVVDGMIITLLSIVKYCKKPLNVYVLTMDLHELDPKFMPINNKHIEILNKILKRENEKSQIHLIDVTEYFKEEMMDSANIKTHYTPYILVRLFSDKVEGLPDKILYIDSDIVVYNNIEPLYNMKIDDYHFAAVKDSIGSKFINKNYINSGVLLLNIKKMKEDNVFENCRKMVEKRKMFMPDQTALNKYCTSKKYIPRKYNEQKKRKDDTVIRHYCMTVKPIVTFNPKKQKLIDNYCSFLEYMPVIKFLNVKPWNVDGIHEIYNIHDFDDVLEQYYEFKGGIK